MMSFKRPLGYWALLSALATAIILSLMLASMIWTHILLLKNGTEITLKTAPIDPRSLLRGYYVRLNYDISVLKPNKLPDTKKDGKAYLFKRNQPIFVKLRQNIDGFWSPLSVHPQIATTEPGIVYLRGRTKSRYCKNNKPTDPECTLTIRYGIEKFFAEKKRAQKLEEFSGQTNSEIEEVRKKIRDRQKASTKANLQASDTNSPDQAQRNKELQALYKQLRSLQQRNNEEMAKRFAVIIKISKTTGEAAISGLQLDGRRIYEERLF